MKIELLKKPIGIPAKFEGNLCETKISKAHQPLVALEEFLPSLVEDFLRTQKFSNSFELEFVEQIDSRYGICLVVNLLVNETELILDFSNMSLRAEFSAFLEQDEKMKSMRTAGISEGYSSVTSSSSGNQAKNGSLVDPE